MFCLQMIENMVTWLLLKKGRGKNPGQRKIEWNNM